MNSCNTDKFFSNYLHLQSVRFELIIVSRGEISSNYALIKILTCVPWEFKLLCNWIMARRATKTTQNPAADFYTISVRQLSNHRGNFKV